MTDKLIFVSCGQQTDKEKRIGNSVKQFIDSKDGFKAYFAESVHSLEDLTKNIFEGLEKCSGLISFMHERGLVSIKDSKWGYRSSVWVNQEIAILAYRRRIEGKEIPILVFKDKNVRLEGAMTSLIVNPKPMKSESETITQINSWLDSTDFPFIGLDYERFKSKWEKLKPTSQKVISALSDEGGTNVKKTALRMCLRERYGMGKDESGTVVRAAVSEFTETDLVKLIKNTYTGDELSINPTWKWHISRELRKLSQ